jgi:hypothetical protein
VRDLAYLAWRRLLAAAAGREVEDEYYERLLNQGDWWKVCVVKSHFHCICYVDKHLCVLPRQAARSVLSTTRIRAILAQCSHPDVQHALLLGPSVTYLGALCVNAPLMFTGAVVTDLGTPVMLSVGRGIGASKPY